MSQHGDELAESERVSRPRSRPNHTRARLTLRATVEHPLRSRAFEHDIRTNNLLHTRLCHQLVDGCEPGPLERVLVCSASCSSSFHIVIERPLDSITKVVFRLVFTRRCWSRKALRSSSMQALWTPQACACQMPRGTRWPSPRQPTKVRNVSTYMCSVRLMTLAASAHLAPSLVLMRHLAGQNLVPGAPYLMTMRAYAHAVC